MRKLWWLLLMTAALALVPVPTSAQGAFYQFPATYSNSDVYVCPLVTVVNPCTATHVNVYNDQALTSLIAQPLHIGSTGAFGFWAAPNQYTVQVQRPYNAVYVITLGGSSTGTVTGSGTPPDIPYWASATGLGDSGCQWDVAGNFLLCPEFDTTGTGPQVLTSPFGIAPIPPAAGQSSIAWDVNGNLEESINGAPFVIIATGNPGTPAVPCGTTPGSIQNEQSGQFGCSSMVDDLIHSVLDPLGINVQTTGGVDYQAANNAVTGTILNRTVCDDGTGALVVCPFASSTADVPLGFAQNNAGTTGSVTARFYGYSLVTVDNTATATHFAIESTTIDGELHDIGTAPTPGQPNFYIFTGNSGAGTNAVIRLVTGDEIALGSSGGGKTKPGGSNTQLQFNDNNAFGGATGLTWDKTTNRFTLTGTHLSTASGTPITSTLVNSSGAATVNAFFDDEATFTSNNSAFTTNHNFNCLYNFSSAPSATNACATIQAGTVNGYATNLTTNLLGQRIYLTSAGTYSTSGAQVGLNIQNYWSSTGDMSGVGQAGLVGIVVQPTLGSTATSGNLFDETGIQAITGATGTGSGNITGHDYGFLSAYRNNSTGTIAHHYGFACDAGDSLVSSQNIDPWCVFDESTDGRSKLGDLTVDQLIDNGLTASTPIYGNSTKQLTSGTFSGNTTEFGTVNGATTSGHQATWDANGNLQDGGAVAGAAVFPGFYCSNNATGTTTGKIARFNGNNCQTVVTGDATTSIIAGVCVADPNSGGAGTCGTTGNAWIQTSGTASVVFDGATTVGQSFSWSGTVNGDGHANAATGLGNKPLLGTVLSTNGGAGTYSVMLQFPGSGTGGGSPDFNIPMVWNNTQATPNNGSVMQPSSLHQFGNAGDVFLASTHHLSFNSTDSNDGANAAGLYAGTATGSQTTADLVEQGDLANTGLVFLNSGLKSVKIVPGSGNIQVAQGVIQTFTLGGNTTFDVFDVPQAIGGIVHFRMCQDGTGGRKVTFNTHFTNPPIVAAAANACTFFMFDVFDSTHFNLMAPATPVHPAALTGQTAALTDTVITHPMVATLVHIGGSVNCTTTSAAATATLNIKYTDTASTAQTVSVTDTCTALVTTGIPNIDIAVRVKADTDITYGVTIANTPTYDVDVLAQSAE